MATPQRFTKGVTTVASTDPLGFFGMLDPTKWSVYFNDFHTYAAGDWTVTETDGAATQALTDGTGGQLLITNTAADNDVVGLQLTKETFLFTAGKRLIFKCRIKVSDATQSDLAIGLHVTDTSPVASAPSDGLYFRKDDGDTNWDITMDTSSAVVASATGIATASTSFVELAYAYDGSTTTTYWVDGVNKGTLSGTPTATEVALSIAIQNGEAVAKTLTVDYIFAALER